MSERVGVGVTLKCVQEFDPRGQEEGSHYMCSDLMEP